MLICVLWQQRRNIYLGIKERKNINSETPKEVPRNLVNLKLSLRNSEIRKRPTKDYFEELG
jgi:hypothetical protein